MKGSSGIGGKNPLSLSQMGGKPGKPKVKIFKKNGEIEIEKYKLDDPRS